MYTLKVSPGCQLVWFLWTGQALWALILLSSQKSCQQVSLVFFGYVYFTTASLTNIWSLSFCSARFLWGYHNKCSGGPFQCYASIPSPHLGTFPPADTHLCCNHFLLDSQMTFAICHCYIIGIRNIQLIFRQWWKKLHFFDSSLFIRDSILGNFALLGGGNHSKDFFSYYALVE